MRSLGTELRTLTSSFAPEVRLTLTSRDGLTTYVHCSDDFIKMSDIDWEMPFTGGFGKPSGYKIDISLPLDDIKTRLSDYNRAEVSLRVDIAGQNFHPHAGRVRKIQRDGFDPNRISLTIVDRFLDDNPLLPVETIADSYTGTHLEEIGPEDGYPLYYGRHHRPFYFTAIDCHINELLGPRNVSSHCHVSSVYFNTDMSAGDGIDDEHVVFMVHSWIQQSGDTNLTSSDYFFNLSDIGPLESKVWQFNGTIARVSIGTIGVNTPGEVLNKLRSQIKTVVNYAKLGSTRGYSISAVFDRVLPVSVFEGNRIAFHSIATGKSDVDLGTDGIAIRVSSGPSHISFGINGADTDEDVSGDVNLHTAADADGREMLGFNVPIEFTWGGADAVSDATGLMIVTHSMFFEYSLESRDYKKFSVFAPIVDSKSLAVVGSNDIIGGGDYIQNQFEGFIGTLDHIFSYHTSTPFLTSQSSLAQAASINSGFLPQCFFAVRRELSEIVDEFGKISATNIWLGDSGMMNYRTYQESANATVDRTITGSDIELKSFDLTESPIGGHLNDHSIFDRISVKFGFHFQKGEYEKSARAYPSNNAMCNSVNAVGVVSDFKFETEYITDPDVASYFLGNLVRLYAQGKETVEFSGGANLFDIELGDVLKVQNPIIVGSESLYQVVRVSMNPLKGKMKISATQLIAGGLT